MHQDLVQTLKQQQTEDPQELQMELMLLRAPPTTMVTPELTQVQMPPVQLLYKGIQAKVVLVQIIRIEVEIFQPPKLHNLPLKTQTQMQIELSGITLLVSYFL